MPPPAEVKQATIIPPDVQNPVDLLLSFIIRPPRSKYKPEQLGPKRFKAACRHDTNQAVHGQRTDLVLENPRGQKLECSLFEPVRRPGAPQSEEEEWEEQLPCVIFLHGNSSCRLEALPLVTLLMPLRISLFCLDFAGSGLSEGEYISLGWFERDDLSTCVNYLRSSGKVSSIALWGRSMGAFTALLHADRDPSIAGLVLDSPFVSLNLLAEELALSRAFLPSPATRAVLAAARSAIQARAGFDIDCLEATHHVSQSFSPALFIAAKDDDVTAPHHAQRLFEAYRGEKEFELIEGNHQSARSEAVRRKAALFLCRTFHSERLDRLLELHAGGLFDIFGAQNLPLQSFGGAHGGLDKESDEICRQMKVIPALSQMFLAKGQNVQRPVAVHVVLKLVEDVSEAGFFVKFKPAEGASVSGSGYHMEEEEPQYLVVIVTAVATMVCRVHNDDLRTVAVGPGVCVGLSTPVALFMDSCGMVFVQAGINDPLKVDVGQAFRGELMMWMMLLRGQSSFHSLSVEDGEATLRESLGDAVLRLRHLGHADGVLTGSLPARMPPGDSGHLPCLLSPMSMKVAPPLGSEGNSSGDSGQFGIKVTGDTELADFEARHGRRAQGWRGRVRCLGEGVVTGIRKRIGA
ncbi:unnamed protein product [Polarella glacialis]|uniref:Serine aminopeptidase S33 domain-containing protein n=1 Tax=Polarella glacialis TaxID=89957 RepID=A0A813J5Y1_POLGL|nr:unnamed protein product [Polarella glacialis]